MHYKVLQRIEAVKSGQSTSLELGGFDLIELPEEVYYLTQLNVLRVRNLQLASNQPIIDILQKFPPKDDSNDDFLTDLEEAEEELKNELLIPRQLQQIDARIGQLRALEVLDLSYNQLESLPERMGDLTNLRQLVLCHNRLTYLPESLTRLPSLQGLNIRNNPIKSRPQFPHLKKYEVYRAHFRSQKNEAIRHRDYQLASWLRQQEMMYGLTT